MLTNFVKIGLCVNHRIAENNKKTRHISYTDVTVRYAPQFRGHDTISVQQGKNIFNSRFLFMYFEQTLVQITIFFPSRCEYTKYYYIMLYIYVMHI